MTFGEWITKVYEDAPFRPTGYRAGQHAYHMLDEHRPDLALLVAGTDIDPFHDDSNLAVFFGWVADAWGEEEPDSAQLLVEEEDRV